MVRYLFLILAVYIAASVIITERWEVSWIVVASSNFAAVFIGYISGRLQKFKKNICWAVIISVLLLIKSFWPITCANDYALFVLDRTMPLFMWLTAFLIYFLRYKEHKQAGLLADAED